MLNKNKTYNWQYVSIGGVVRVKIDSGEAISRLGELDQKKWTVLSCPVDGLDIDRKTLQYIDTDGDGKIRVSEVVAAAQWLTSAVSDKDGILKGEDHIEIGKIADETLRKSAIQILKNLGIKKEIISIAESSDAAAIFANTKFNGDGIITARSTDTPSLAATITDCISSVGGVPDRSGNDGIDIDRIEKFYTALEEYSAWKAAAAANAEVILPYGDDTAAALAAYNTVKEKIDDYYMRCKLIRFDEAVASAVDVSADRIAGISGRNISSASEEIASCPIARPTAGAVLPFDAINPAWQEAFNGFKALVLDNVLAGKTGMTEEEWNGITAGFAPYTGWLASKKGSEVEHLGIDRVNALLTEGKKSVLVSLVEKDKALEEESASIDAVDKLLHLYRDFYKLLRNYVTFSDFYARRSGLKGAFEAGELYIDERCCNLCIKVSDMGAHADMAGLSGMFLIYCKCSSKTRNQTFDIVAAMTDGSVRNLRPGKNAIFYDLKGESWDAVVTKVVDNPISIKQAFWSPYRKLANYITEKIEKSAAKKDAEATANLITKVDGTAPAEAPKKAPFDIAKFAGIFAAIGMAIGYIGAFITSIATGIATTPAWKTLLFILGLMLIVSGPACLLAWFKLRKRNLGPVLNANGWAINSSVLVNILFGGTLTSTAKYPIIKGEDPFRKKLPCWRKTLRASIAALVIAFGVLYFTNNLKFIGIDRHKDADCTETVTAETATDSPAGVAEVPAEVADTTTSAN